MLHFNGQSLWNSAASQERFCLEFCKFCFSPWASILSAIHLHLIPSLPRTWHSPSCHAIVVQVWSTLTRQAGRGKGEKKKNASAFYGYRRRAGHPVQRRSIKTSHVGFVAGCQDDGTAALFNLTSSSFPTSIQETTTSAVLDGWGVLWSCDRITDESKAIKISFNVGCWLQSEKKDGRPTDVCPVKRPTVLKDWDRLSYSIDCHLQPLNFQPSVKANYIWRKWGEKMVLNHCLCTSAAVWCAVFSRCTTLCFQLPTCQRWTEPQPASPVVRANTWAPCLTKWTSTSYMVFSFRLRFHLLSFSLQKYN